MDKSPLVAEQIEAGERLIREFERAFPLQAAFWLRESDSEEWYLFLASDRINDANVDVAYREVLRINPPTQSLWMDPFQVKVIGADAPVARAAHDLMNQYPGKIPLRYHGRLLGDRSVDEAFIYPLPLPLSA